MRELKLNVSRGDSVTSPFDWMSLLAASAVQTEKSLIREMFNRLKSGEITSFAGGLPDSACFPYTHVQAAFDEIFEDKKQRVTALNYGPFEGYLPLREWIATHMNTLGVKCQSDNILMTSGGQQGLDLICRALISPNDKVIVSAPTYLGALQILRTYGTDIISIPTDDEGPVVEEFAEALEKNPKFIYLVSDFSNPSGQTISKIRRKVLIRLARSKGVPIVDDAAYQQLRFEGEPIEPMLAQDQIVSVGATQDPLSRSGVVHIGTFSKTMMPGLRVGWIVAAQSFLKALVPLKQATDLHSPILNQMITQKVVSKIYPDHIALLRKTYGRKRDVMISAAQKHFPQHITYTEPEGGMFVWVSLPEGCDATKLLEISMDTAKVAYIPGSSFFTNSEDGQRHCRFSFSSRTEEEINLGIERFGALISKEF